jgi:hypothetical protein
LRQETWDSADAVRDCLFVMCKYGWAG